MASTNSLVIDISTSPKFEDKKTVLKKVLIDNNGLILNSKVPVEVDLELADDYLNTKLYARATYHNKIHEPHDDSDDPVSDSVSFSMTDHHILYNYAVGICLENYTEDKLFNHHGKEILFDYQGKEYPYSLSVHNPTSNKVLNDIVEIVDKSSDPSYMCKVLKVKKFYVRCLPRGFVNTTTENKPVWIIASEKLSSDFTVHPAFLRPKRGSDGEKVLKEADYIEYRMGIPGGLSVDDVVLSYQGDPSHLYIAGITYNAIRRKLDEKYTGIMSNLRYYTYFDAGLLTLLLKFFEGFEGLDAKHKEVIDKAKELKDGILSFFGGGAKENYCYGIFTDLLKRGKGSVTLHDPVSDEIIGTFAGHDGEGWYQESDFETTFKLGKYTYPVMVLMGMGKGFKVAAGQNTGTHKSFGGSFFPVEGIDIVTGFGGNKVFFPGVLVGYTVAQTYFAKYMNGKNPKEPYFDRLPEYTAWKKCPKGIMANGKTKMTEPDGKGGTKTTFADLPIAYWLYQLGQGPWSCPEYDKQKYICSNKANEDIYWDKACRLSSYNTHTACHWWTKRYWMFQEVAHQKYFKCTEYETGINEYLFGNRKGECPNVCADSACKALYQKPGLPILEDKNIDIPFHPLNMVTIPSNRRIGLSVIHPKEGSETPTHYPFARLCQDIFE